MRYPAHADTFVDAIRPTRPDRYQGLTTLMTRKAAKKTSRRAAGSGAVPATKVESQRKHTINDIARLANVSKKTVSRVINESPFVHEETRKRIVEIMESVSYKPDPQARGLA